MEELTYKATKKNIIEILIDKLDFFVLAFWLLFGCVVLLGSVFVKALYHMEDYPYFVRNTVADILLVFVLLLFVFWLFKYRDYIQERISFAILWLVFGFIAISFVLLIPLIPFSDMHYVSEGAILISKLDFDAIKSSEYLQLVIKNIKVSMFYGAFALLLPSNMLTFKMINVFLYLLSSHFISLISRELGFSFYKITFILSASYVPIILYCNHIYFDLPSLCLCSIAMYFYIKGGNIEIILSAICLGLACGLRVLAYIFLLAIIIDYIFTIVKKDDVKGKKVMIMILFMVISLAIPKGISVIVDNNFKAPDSEEESIWTNFYMGINEEEFGFMHNEILEEGQKTFDDFITCLNERNLDQNLRLFAKKTFWLWSQGTYQAQRYGFGFDTDNPLDKYQYETIGTELLLKDSYALRQLTNSFCRAQYFVLFIMMCVGTVRIIRNHQDISKYRIMYYIMFGTFLIMIFYELKSRYVFHCIIPMVAISMVGMECVFGSHKTTNNT